MGVRFGGEATHGDKNRGKRKEKEELARVEEKERKIRVREICSGLSLQRAITKGSYAQQQETDDSMYYKHAMSRRK